SEDAAIMTNVSGPDHAAEAPLDPAVERVRRRLLRFAVINIGILFAAVIVVLGAIVYKTMRLGDEPAGSVGVPPAGVVTTGEIALPAGARILSQALSGDRMSLQVRLADGRQAIFLYDLPSNRMIGRFTVSEDE